MPYRNELKLLKSVASVASVIAMLVSLFGQHGSWFDHLVMMVGGYFLLGISHGAGAALKRMD